MTAPTACNSSLKFPSFSPVLPPSPSVLPSFNTGAVTVKLPQFWAADPIVWFAQVEAQFGLAHVVSEQTKYGHVVAILPPEAAAEVRDLLLSPPDIQPYTKLKELLLERLTPSPQKQLRQLLNTEELGDRTPSKLLRSMRRLMGAQAGEDALLRELFLQRLPSQVQMILAASPQDSLDALAKLADKVMENSPASITSVNSSITAPQNTVAEQMAELTAAVTNLKLSQDKRSNSQAQHKLNLCYYHRRFGNKARKCQPGCTHYAKSRSQGNDGVSHN